MVGFRSPVILLACVVATGCQSWIGPLAGVGIEPTRPARTEQDFGPDSAFRLLVCAGELPPESDATKGWQSLLDRFQEHPWPARAPQAVAAAQPWSSRDHAKIRAILGAAGPNLALARQAVAAPDPQVPTAPSPGTSINTPIFYLGTAHDVARLLVISAYTKEGMGDSSEAFRDLLTCIRFGNIVSRGGTAIGHLVDAAITARASDALWRIPTRTDVPAPVLRRTAQELLSIADGVEPLAEAMRHESQGALAVVDTFSWSGVHVASGEPPLGFGAWLRRSLAGVLTGSTRAAMKRDFTYLFQHLVDLADKPYCEGVSREARALADALEAASSHSVLPKRNPGGLNRAKVLVSVLSRPPDKLAERDASLRAAALYLAILACEKETGVPPKALVDLVPAYLPRVPLDPFDGKPLRYIVGETPEAWGDAAWGIYSIGRNRRDDGGAGTRRWSWRDPDTDIVWIPEPFPKVAPPIPKGGLFGGGL